VPLPPQYDDRLSPFQKVMIIKAIKEQKLIGSIREFVKKEIGQKFIESPPFDLFGSYQDSSNVTPIIFILSAGADPIP